MSDRKLHFGMAALIVFALMLMVFGLMIGAWKAGYASTVITPAPQQPETPTLPQKCFKYYDDGTDAWIDCMGVGYVRSMVQSDI